MKKEGITHHASGAYAYPVGEARLKLTLRAAKGDLRSCRVRYDDRYSMPGAERLKELKLTTSDQLHDFFQGTIEVPERRFRYVFELDDGHEVLWFGEKGFSARSPLGLDFHYSYIGRGDGFLQPEWIKRSVIYEIFPDRFFNGDERNDPDGCRPWGELPTRESFFGGDLEGIRQKLGYLGDLGVNALYLTPIFDSPSNHKYNTTNYMWVDPAFGDAGTLRELVASAHQAGMKVILDGVFNHCGHDFWAFRDVVEKGPTSNFVDWFNIHGFPIQFNPEPNYETWARNVHTMPKLMTDHPAVREYLLGVANHWIKEADIDGWRLDVADEVDHSFWREFRKAIKGTKPDAFILGEVWHNAERWLGGDQFDSVMNYPWREAVTDFFAQGKSDAGSFDAALAHLRMAYSDEVNAGLVNLLGSHDTPRFLTVCGDDTRKMSLAVVFQMTYPGVPMVYYGDEVGMKGDSDPDCRRTMIWDPEQQDQDLLGLYRRLIGLRRAWPWLSSGAYQTWEADGPIYAYWRTKGIEWLGTIINNSAITRRVTLPVKKDITSILRDRPIVDMLSGGRFEVKDSTLKVDLGPYSSTLLVPRGGA